MNATFLWRYRFREAIVSVAFLILPFLSRSLTIGPSAAGPEETNPDRPSGTLYP